MFPPQLPTTASATVDRFGSHLSQSIHTLTTNSVNSVKLREDAEKKLRAQEEIQDKEDPMKETPKDSARYVRTQA